MGYLQSQPYSWMITSECKLFFSHQILPLIGQLNKIYHHRLKMLVKNAMLASIVDSQLFYRTPPPPQKKKNLLQLYQIRSFKI